VTALSESFFEEIVRHPNNLPKKTPLIGVRDQVFDNNAINHDKFPFSEFTDLERRNALSENSISVSAPAYTTALTSARYRAS
jgi:hypothetical protein